MAERVLVKNAADSRQVREAGKRERWTREQELADIRHLLSLVQFRRFVWRYLGRCGLYQTSFSDAANQTYFLEGKRQVGLEIMADITEADPDSYLRMMNEAKVREKAEAPPIRVEEPNEEESNG